MSKKKKRERERERRRRLYQAKKKAGLLKKRTRQERAAKALERDQWERRERPSWIIPRKSDWRLKKRQRP
jgi:hypothetical protein